jgi:hypothetical protein
MTVRGMQLYFDSLIQTVHKEMEIGERPDSTTILYFLNKSQEEYTKITYLSAESVSKNIELLQKRSDELRKLIARYNSTLATFNVTTVDGGIAIELPTDYLYYIKSYSYITNTFTGHSTPIWTPNRVIRHFELDKVVSSITNDPILRKPCIVFEEDSVILYKDRDTTITDFEYIYLRKPKTLVIDSPDGDETTECELEEFTHKTIVENAVKMFTDDYKFRLARKDDTKRNV